MNEKDNRHVVDILFVIALFGVFVVAAMFLISVGANVYGKTMTNMDANFTSRTAVAYITEKIHQADEDGAVDVGDFGGNNAICIKQNINDIDYITYIYELDGELCELTQRGDIELDPEAGQGIISVKDFSVSKPYDNLISCTVDMDDDDSYSFNVALHSERQVRSDREAADE